MNVSLDRWKETWQHGQPMSCLVDEMRGTQKKLCWNWSINFKIDSLYSTSQVFAPPGSTLLHLNSWSTSVRLTDVWGSPLEHFVVVLFRGFLKTKLTAPTLTVQVMFVLVPNYKLYSKQYCPINMVHVIVAAASLATFHGKLRLTLCKTFLEVVVWINLLSNYGNDHFYSLSLELQLWDWLGHGHKVWVGICNVSVCCLLLSMLEARLWDDLLRESLSVRDNPIYSLQRNWSTH